MSNHNDTDDCTFVPPPPKSARIMKESMDSDSDEDIGDTELVSGRVSCDADTCDKMKHEPESESMFSENKINDPVTIIIVADKGVGKTTLAAALFESFCKTIDIDAGLALTYSDDPMYFSNILPNNAIIRKKDPRNVALDIMRVQKQIQSENIRNVARVCVVFDDVFNTSVDFKGMEDFFRNSHVANVLPIYTVSDPSVVPRSLQDRADFVFIARSMKHGTRSKCWKTFGDIYEKFDEFNDALSRLGKHSFLAIDKTSRSTNLNDIVSSYTPTIKESRSITFDNANAYGKWHLVSNMACRHDMSHLDDTHNYDDFSIKCNERSNAFYEKIRTSLGL